MSEPSSSIVPLLELSDLNTAWNALQQPGIVKSKDQIETVARIIFNTVGFCSAKIFLGRYAHMNKVEDKLNEIVSKAFRTYALLMLRQYGEAFSNEMASKSAYDGEESTFFFEKQIKLFFRKFPLPIQQITLSKNEGKLTGFKGLKKNVAEWIAEEDFWTQQLKEHLDEDGLLQGYNETNQLKMIQFLFSKAALCFKDHQNGQVTIRYETWFETIHAWIKKGSAEQIHRVKGFFSSIKLDLKLKDKTAVKATASFYEFLIGRSYAAFIQSLKLEFPNFLQDYVINAFKKDEWIRKEILYLAAEQEQKLTKTQSLLWITQILKDKHFKRYLELAEWLQQEKKFTKDLYHYPLSDQSWLELKETFKTPIPSEKLLPALIGANKLLELIKEKRPEQFIQLFVALVKTDNPDEVVLFLRELMNFYPFNRGSGICLESELLPFIAKCGAIGDFAPLKANLKKVQNLVFDEDDPKILTSIPLTFWSELLLESEEAFSLLFYEMRNALKKAEVNSYITNTLQQESSKSRLKQLLITFYGHFLDFLNGHLNFNQVLTLMQISQAICKKDQLLHFDYSVLKEIETGMNLIFPNSAQKGSPNTTEVYHPNSQSLSSRNSLSPLPNLLSFTEPSFHSMTSTPVRRLSLEPHGITSSSLQNEPVSDESKEEEVTVWEQLDQFNQMLTLDRGHMAKFLELFSIAWNSYRFTDRQLLALFFEYLPRQYFSDPNHLKEAIQKRVRTLEGHFYFFDQLSAILHFKLPQDFLFHWLMFAPEVSKTLPLMSGLIDDIREIDAFNQLTRSKSKEIFLPTFYELHKKIKKRLASLAECQPTSSQSIGKIYREMTLLTFDEISLAIIPATFTPVSSFLNLSVIRSQSDASKDLTKELKLISPSVQEGLAIYRDWEIPATPTEHPCMVFSILNLSSQEAFHWHMALPWSYQHIVKNPNLMEKLLTLTQQFDLEWNSSLLEDVPYVIQSFVISLRSNYIYAIRWLAHTGKEKLAVQQTISKCPYSYTYVTGDSSGTSLIYHEALSASPVITHITLPVLDELLEEITTIVLSQTSRTVRLSLNIGRQEAFEDFWQDDQQNHYQTNEDPRYLELKYDTDRHTVEMTIGQVTQIVYYHNLIHQKNFPVMLRWQLSMQILKLYRTTGQILRF